MTRRRAGIVLLLIQLALVLSVAGKYLYERATRPRLWVRATQFDPATPLRGRYLALQLVVDACGLPHDENHNANANLMVLRSGASAVAPPPATRTSARWSWRVMLHPANGTLFPTLAENHGTVPDDSYEVWQTAEMPCNRGTVREELQYFLPEHAEMPSRLKPGQDLWVEVTVPKQGPPRPIQLALSGSDGFHLLKLR